MTHYIEPMQILDVVSKLAPIVASAITIAETMKNPRAKPGKKRKRRR
ncbi:MAG: hypothetical protein LBN05_08165 [Oscillospiraceae bacterium]|jgi:hypothetical protein|nr:hypothetical protein [Oscillospiraceae bacterium]